MSEHTECHHEHAHHDHKHHEHTAEGASREETLALLSYMVSHNKHHAEELSDLSAHVSGEARSCLLQAIKLFGEGNQELEKALTLMKQ